ncbi:hypothetical protein [Streptomyces niveus]|uniref:hypothetical protein n=1 Tax=Streptomyces niveus TaxID=193462 RepID=UPI00343182AA
MDAVGSVGPPTLAQRQLPPLEVGEELLPLLGGDSPVFLGWAEIAATGEACDAAAILVPALGLGGSS